MCKASGYVECTKQWSVVLENCADFVEFALFLQNYLSPI